MSALARLSTFFFLIIREANLLSLTNVSILKADLLFVRCYLRRYISLRLFDTCDLISNAGLIPGIDQNIHLQLRSSNTQSGEELNAARGKDNYDLPQQVELKLINRFPESNKTFEYLSKLKYCFLAFCKRWLKITAHPKLIFMNLCFLLSF